MEPIGDSFGYRTGGDQLWFYIEPIKKVLWIKPFQEPAMQWCILDLFEKENS